MRLVLRVLAALALGTALWAVLGLLATVPLGWWFGWSGHPAIPSAPLAVYVGIYGIALPVLCVWSAWRLVSLVYARVGRES
jgi:hypothetical protein